jgi:hypothetical protein
MRILRIGILCLSLGIVLSHNLFLHHHHDEIAYGIDKLELHDHNDHDHLNVDSDHKPRHHQHDSEHQHNHNDFFGSLHVALCEFLDAQNRTISLLNLQFPNDWNGVSEIIENGFNLVLSIYKPPLIFENQYFYQNSQSEYLAQFGLRGPPVTCA